MLPFHLLYFLQVDRHKGVCLCSHRDSGSCDCCPTGGGGAPCRHWADPAGCTADPLGAIHKPCRQEGREFRTDCCSWSCSEAHGSSTGTSSMAPGMFVPLKVSVSSSGSTVSLIRALTFQQKSWLLVAMIDECCVGGTACCLHVWLLLPDHELCVLACQCLVFICASMLPFLQLLAHSGPTQSACTWPICAAWSGHAQPQLGLTHMALLPYV